MVKKAFTGLIYVFSLYVGADIAQDFIGDGLRTFGYFVDLRRSPEQRDFIIQLYFI
jgi:hypothetical protein